MNLLPSCSHYIRRFLKRKSKSYSILDLLEANRITVDRQYDGSLEGRLHILYPADYAKVILHLEKLVYSHQKAQAHRDQTALQHITNSLLWWLGYSGNIHPTQTKIFIVDDTIETLKLLTTLLSQAGYQTTSAFNGHLALEKIPSVNPDLILLDINLPDIDGHQVYHTLQKCSKTANIPVIFLSGIDHTGDIQRYDQHRVGYLSKPFKPYDLIKYVSNYIEVSVPDDISNHKKVSLDEFESRQHYAQKLVYFSSATSSQNHEIPSNDLDSLYFFRATLDGRYLKISQAFSQLYGYESNEDMLSSVTNLWEQCYVDSEHQGQWSICLQYPNESQTWSTKIRTKQNQVLEVTEKVSLIQDRYKRNLFYQGYFCLPL